MSLFPEPHLNILSRGKVNLLLRALGRRDDGYTEILTILQTISLADRLSISLTPSGIEVVCPHPDVPDGEGNLAHRAAVLFLSLTGKPGGARVRIEKYIPVSAGLGGGSSNAAAVLTGLNRLHGNPLSEGDLADLASRLGSDVPFFLNGGTALGKGRGEILETLPDLPEMPLVVVFPGRGMSAAEAYGLLHDDLTAGEADISIVLKALEKGDLMSVLSQLTNDLEGPVFRKRPDIRRAGEALTESGAILSMMAGSGAACFGLFPGESEALAAASGLSRHVGWLVESARFSP